MNPQHRLYQKAYCSTIDWKTGVVLLHERVAVFAGQAAAAVHDPLKQLKLETCALKILHFLMLNLAQARYHPEADRPLCERLLRLYGCCMQCLAEGRDLEAAAIIKSTIGRNQP